MSEYTTGEMAKHADVTVRTVQYYDKRNILKPSNLSEGGRRLYNDDDLKKLKLICYLRQIGLSIDSISDILKEDNSKKVISTILSQQILAVKEDIEKQKKSLSLAQSLLREFESADTISVESINDIVMTMENKKALKNIHIKMIIVGLITDAIEVSTILIWVLKGIWIPFAVGMIIVTVLIIWIFNLYCKNISYICPECHKVFKPSKKEIFFAKHTPKTRKLTCTHCKKKSYCAEIAGK
ncbi:MAG: MerR family transcriptional regulator [Acetobacter sp.]|nr:MerR family transcriptional regulator [Bacteroides sp.]MCM1341968.1 MerR family transcriptional regulator [Acetobacter sp.]MCM1434153.1 MerR family transcriptional regulator [Clostridiales bacterium]